MSRAAAHPAPPPPARSRSDVRARPVADPTVEGLRTWVTLVDRFLDPVLGLLAPGLGDVVGSMLGAGVIATAVRRKLPPIVIARMLINLAIDAVVGAIPLAGDIFDFAFQANKQNLALLVARHEQRKSTWRDWLIVVGSIAALLLALAAAVFIAWRLVSWACSA